MKLEEIQSALREEKLDGWLFFDHHFRDPLGYRVLGIAPTSIPSRRWYYLVPAQGEPRGLVHKIESGMLGNLPGSRTAYAEKEAQYEGLKKLLAGCKAIAMQYSPNCAIPYVSMVDGGTLELIRGLGVEVRSSANLVQKFESCWTAEQRDMHFEAGRRVDKVRAEAQQRVGEKQRAGETITEWDIQQFIMRRFTESGLTYDHGPIVGVNGNASDAHYDPQKDKCSPIRPGDSLLIDLWAKLDKPNAVYYDITWMAFCGQNPPSKLENLFSIVTGARNAAINFVKSEIAAHTDLRGFQVDDVTRAVIRQAGYAEHFFHRTGHSIGPEVHGTGANMDNLETHDDRKVIPWTCFSIEPGIYLPDFGVRSEVNMFIGEDGAQVTGAIQDRLVLI